MHNIGIPQQNPYKQPTDRVLERSTSTKDVDQVPILKGSQYLFRMVDSHTNGNPLNKEKGTFYFGLENEEILQRGRSSIWDRGSGKGGEGPSYSSKYSSLGFITMVAKRIQKKIHYRPWEEAAPLNLKGFSAG